MGTRAGFGGDRVTGGLSRDWGRRGTGREPGGRMTGTMGVVEHGKTGRRAGWVSGLGNRARDRWCSRPWCSRCDRQWGDKRQKEDHGHGVRYHHLPEAARIRALGGQGSHGGVCQFCP